MSILIVDETNAPLPAAELTMEVAKVVSREDIAGLTAPVEDTVPYAMVRVLVGVTVTYNVTVVSMVVIDAVSSTTPVASLETKLVIVDPALGNS